MKKYYWTVLSGIWILLGLFMTNQFYLAYRRAGQPISWGQAFAFEMVYVVLWILLAPAVIAITRRFPINLRRWPVAVIVHIGAAVLLSCLTMAVRRLFQWYYIDGMYEELSVYRLLTTSYLYMDYGIMSYLLILLITYAFDYYRQFRERELAASQLETRLIQAQLQMLRMQLNPHFLFNTLHTIANLVRVQDTRTAIETISVLSELLRRTLYTSDTREVPLKDELEFVELYLRIQRIRFRDRLTVSIQTDPEALKAAVPNMILQPLAENAIVHGLAPHARSGTVEIRAVRENGHLHIAVRDDGPGFPDPGCIRKGIGLTNSEARLERLYGSAYRFELRNDDPRGATVNLWIPYHLAETAE